MSLALLAPPGLRRAITGSPTASALWALYRGRQQDRAIRLEQRTCERRAREIGVSPVMTSDELRKKLRQRLDARGVRVRAGSAPHVLYVSSLSEWEKTNIPPALEQLGRLTTFYLKEHGFEDRASDWLTRRNVFEEKLVSFIQGVHSHTPIDLVICYLSGWHVGPDTIERINQLGIVTANFSFDDRLWFTGPIRGGRPIGTAPLANAFDLNLTNATDSLVKYFAEGGLALFWPPGANPEHFRRLDRPFRYDVSFIGACYGLRPAYVRFLRRQGLRVATFGPRWPEGPVPAEDMVEIYAASRINLGFSGIGYSMTETCLKGRDFEVPMAGGLYLTTWQPDLERAFDVGREVAAYRSRHDCVAQIRSLLRQPDLCADIRQSAFDRSRSAHSWRRRFQEVFDLVGLHASSETKTVQASGVS